MRSIGTKMDTYRIEAFKAFMILKNFSKQSIKSYTQCVSRFVNWWLSMPGVVPLSDNIVGKYLLHRSDFGRRSLPIIQLYISGLKMLSFWQAYTRPQKTLEDTL